MFTLSTVKFVNNCNHAVHLKISTDNFFFLENKRDWFYLQPKSTQVLTLHYNPSTQDINFPKLVSFETFIVYKNDKRSPLSRFNINTQVSTQPCISITYRPMVVEKEGLLVLMILWLVALFFCLLGPFVLIKDTEDKNSKSWAIVGFVCLVIALGFSAFFVTCFVLVHSKRHHRVHENTKMNDFLCKSFGKNCVSIACS